MFFFLMQETPNILKSAFSGIAGIGETKEGGDFMERNEHEGVYRDIEDFEAELGRRGADSPSIINPAQAIGSGDIVNSRFPERVGRTRDIPALEVPDVVSPPELRSEQSMIGGE